MTDIQAAAANIAEIEDHTRDLAEVPAVEVISATAVHLMSAAAVKLGLAPDGEHLRDLDEARRLITALAGLVTASAEYLGIHAAPLRAGLQSLQRAFREASTYPDEPGSGPGEQTSLRVTSGNRDALARIAATELGGVSLDDALRVVLFEHQSAV